MLESIVGKALLDSAKQLIDEMGIERLCSRMMEIPDEIKAKSDCIIEKQKEIVALEIRIASAQGALDNDRIIVVAEVATEIDPVTQKPRFTNDKIRDAEVARRLNANSDYMSGKNTIEELKGQISGLQFDVQGLRSEIGKLEAQMANYRVVVTARAAQIRALFGGQV